jgi:hypothetical protein
MSDEGHEEEEKVRSVLSVMASKQKYRIHLQDAIIANEALCLI